MNAKRTTWKIVLLTAAIGVTGLGGWAIGRRLSADAPVSHHPKRESVSPVKKYDPLLLKKLLALNRQIDFNNTNCTYAGVINMVDKADTARTHRNISFLFCRKGANYYYQLGNTETIHHDGINIYIENDRKIVVLSRQQIRMKGPSYTPDSLAKVFQGESYEMVTRTDSGTRTISAINERHISCKELSASYDTVSGKLVRIYTRMCEMSDPFNKKKERYIEVRFTRIGEKAALRQYHETGDVAREIHGAWTLTDKYANYQLIKMKPF